MKKRNIGPSCVNCKHYEELGEIIDLFCNVKNKSSKLLRFKARHCKHYKNDIFKTV